MTLSTPKLDFKQLITSCALIEGSTVISLIPPDILIFSLTGPQGIMPNNGGFNKTATNNFLLFLMGRPGFLTSSEKGLNLLCLLLDCQDGNSWDKAFVCAPDGLFKPLHNFTASGITPLYNQK